jgi:hypothetical protein
LPRHICDRPGSRWHQSAGRALTPCSRTETNAEDVNQPRRRGKLNVPDPRPSHGSRCTHRTCNSRLKPVSPRRTWGFESLPGHARSDQRFVAPVRPPSWSATGRAV